MDPFIKEMATSLIPMILGGIGTGLGWLGRSIFRVKSDLNAAHCKIRKIEDLIAKQSAELLDVDDRVSYLED